METFVRARTAGTTGFQLQQIPADLGFCVREICNCLETKSSSKQYMHERKKFIL